VITFPSRATRATRAAARTEPELLHELVSAIRTGRHLHLSDALLAVARHESPERFWNLAAALARELHAPPINSFDRDELPRRVDDGWTSDHPGSYATRLDIWAARVGYPEPADVFVEALATLAQLELEAPSNSAIVGGRSFRGYIDLNDLNNLIGGAL
jgi:hypothetical protein